MTNEKMTITKALSEMKILDKRINEEISGACFCTHNKHIMKTCNGKPIATTKAEMTGVYDKITNMIARLNAIKKAVTQANATVKIKINDTEMTIAEAIYYKTTGVIKEKMLVNAISNQYQRSVNTINQNNGDNLTKACEDYITKLFGSKENRTETSDVETVKTKYIEENTLDLIEGYDTKKIIENLKDKIDNFEAEVDAAITVANATTEIEISY